MKIINVVGARPNFMKIAPIQRAMAAYPGLSPFLVHTGQHYDEKMSRLFFEDLEMPEPDVYLGVGSGSHSEQTARIMVAFEKIVEQEKPDLVIVVGDVNSTAACSLVAAKMHVPVAHVEAGLRSFDREMPEEINRIITDALSDFLFVTERSGLENLRNEGIPGSKVFFCGNVMIDSLIHFLARAEQSDIRDVLKVDSRPYVLVTLHRPNNVDHPETLAALTEAFSRVSEELKIIFPVHPRTRKNLKRFGLTGQVNRISNLVLSDPVGYLDFLHLMRHAALVLTDSGGIQEETTYLQIPCITMRPTTERPVTIDIGTNRLVRSTADDVTAAVSDVMAGKQKKGRIPELWDGKAAERIVKIIAEEGPRE